jgi:hypothetical protein
VYRDAVLKIDFYKAKIMQELSKRGVYPDDLTVQSRVNGIDNGLAVFRYMEATPGLEFDTEKYNTDMTYIWQDLYFLYRLVYELTVKEYVSLKSYVDCHLAELEDMARKYRYKTQLEIGSTALGKTIFFQANGYSASYKDDTMVIALGSITAAKGSRLACIFDADDISSDKVIFSFGNKNCSPYSYNQDFFRVPGEARTVTHNFNLPTDLLINSSFQLNVANFKPKIDSQYIVFGGKDTVAQYDSSSNQTFIKKQQGNPCVVLKAGRIEFYVYKGTFINFDFSKQPLNKNFAETTVNNLKKHHKIVLECEANFVFDFVTDGQVYAVRRDGVVKDDKLYYPTAVQVHDFLIEEFLPGEIITYDNVVVTVIDVGNDPASINTIAIKELSSLEVLDE